MVLFKILAAPLPENRPMVLVAPLVGIFKLSMVLPERVFPFPVACILIPTKFAEVEVPRPALKFHKFLMVLLLMVCIPELITTIPFTLVADVIVE
jgi:hypothetical protein